MTAYYARVPGGRCAAGAGRDLRYRAEPGVRSESDIEIERHVILQEIGQALDTPDDIIFDWLHEAAYPDQAFGRTILGPAERVGAFGHGDLRRLCGASITARTG